jgi:glycosyltransferase involved in cell wall biosynthesis
MRLMTRLAVRSADRIIAVSGATRDDLTRVLRVPDDKVTVIHEAVAPQFAIPCDTGAVEAVLRRYGIRRPYCLFVGNLEPRKNLARLVEAFGLLRTRDLRGPDGATAPQLVLAGGRGWLYKGIFADLATRGGLGEIVFTGHVPADLPALYAAACFVFRRCMRLRLPVLEAMAAGTPVARAPAPSGGRRGRGAVRRCPAAGRAGQAIAAVLTDRAPRPPDHHGRAGPGCSAGRRSPGRRSRCTRRCGDARARASDMRVAFDARAP